MTVQVKLNREGVAALLASAEVGEDLTDRGRRIAAAAGPGVEMSRRKGRGRQRVSIITGTAEARKAEAERMALTSALDAGR